jgi:hypothetical protein
VGPYFFLKKVGRGQVAVGGLRKKISNQYSLITKGVQKNFPDYDK